MAESATLNTGHTGCADGDLANARKSTTSGQLSLAALAWIVVVNGLRERIGEGVAGRIAGAAWGPYHRNYIDMEELSLAPGLVDDSRQMDEVLTALEVYIGGGQVPLHIGGINGQAEAPWIREMLEQRGYVWESGHFVKPAGL